METGFFFPLLFVRNLRNDLGVIQNRNGLIGKLRTQHEVTVIGNAENGFISVRVARCRTCGFFLIIIINVCVDAESRTVYVECHRRRFCLIFHQLMLRCHCHFRRQIIEPVACTVDAQLRCIALLRREVTLQISISDFDIRKVYVPCFPIGQVHFQFPCRILVLFQFFQGKGFHLFRTSNAIRQECGQLDAFDHAALGVVGRDRHLVRQIALYDLGAVLFCFHTYALEVNGNQRLPSLGVAVRSCPILQQETIVQTICLIRHSQTLIIAFLCLRTIGRGCDLKVGLCHLHGRLRGSLGRLVDAANDFEMRRCFQIPCPVRRTIQFQIHLLEIVQICISVDAGEDDAHTSQALDIVGNGICNIAVCIHRQGIRIDRQTRLNICLVVCGICRIIPIKKFNSIDLCRPSCTDAVQNDLPGIKALHILETVDRLIADAVHIDLQQRMRAGRTGVVGQQELIPGLFRFAPVRHSQCRINGMSVSVFVIADRLFLVRFCAVLANRMNARFQFRQHLGHVQCDGIFHRLIQGSLVVFAKAIIGFQHAVRCDILFCGRCAVNLHIAVPVIVGIRQRNIVADALEVHGHTSEIGQLTAPRRLRNFQVSVCICAVAFQLIQCDVQICQRPPVVHLSVQHDLLDRCLFQQTLAEQDVGCNQSAGSAILVRIQTSDIQCCRADLGNAVVGNDKASRRSIIIQRDCLRIAFLYQIADGVIINAYAGQCRFCLLRFDNCILFINIFRLRNPLAFAVFRRCRRLVIVNLIRGVDLVVICPQVRKCTTHGDKTVEVGIAWDLLPEHKLDLIAECQTSLCGQCVANGKRPDLFVCCANIGILFQTQAQFVGSFIDHITVFIGKAKLDKLIEVCSIHLEPVFQLNVRIVYRIILQIDLDFLQVKIFRHVVCCNGIEHRDIADAVEPIQVIFIHRTDANRLICYFFAVCVLDIFVMRKVIPGMGRELCSVRTLFRPVNAAAAAERNCCCQSRSVFESGVAVKVVRIRNRNHVLPGSIVLSVGVTLVQFLRFLLGIQHMGFVGSFSLQNDRTCTGITIRYGFAGNIGEILQIPLRFPVRCIGDIIDQNTALIGLTDKVMMLIKISGNICVWRVRIILAPAKNILIQDTPHFVRVILRL